MPQNRTAWLVCALVFLALSCGSPSTDQPDTDDVMDETLDQPLTFDCAGAAVCSGPTTGTTPTHTSLHRVGTTGSARSELRQAFTLAADGTPTTLRLPFRQLRPFTAPTTKPQLRVDVWEASACVTDCLGSPVAQGTAELAPTTSMGTLAVTFTEANQLPAGAYVMTLSADTAPGDGSGTVLVGLGSLPTDSFAGVLKRRALRWSATLGNWAPSRFRPTGMPALAFAFEFTAAPSSRHHWRVYNAVSTERFTVSGPTSWVNLGNITVSGLYTSFNQSTFTLSNYGAMLSYTTRQSGGVGGYYKSATSARVDEYGNWNINGGYPIHKRSYTKTNITYTYTKGTTTHSPVSSLQRNDYPDNGYQGGRWYVYDGEY